MATCMTDCEEETPDVEIFEQRAGIKVCCTVRSLSKEKIYNALKEIHGSKVMSYEKFLEWYQHFQSGKTSIYYK
ncbi:hypothetical protein X777_05147 [Ooceraea biroi]|uniref:Mos1 transposase HTH domain-containing protein n=1 Tax=Ooceraea biroi TaxID=2015173 RepID=A0A026WGP1_OOCBI|nr:hypothetical protein X777_05147 [Ooceraea biroi]